MTRRSFFAPAIFFCLFLSALRGPAQSAGNDFHIIPKPTSVLAREGSFALNTDTRVYVPAGKPDWELAARYFMGLAQTSTGLKLTSQPLRRDLTIPRKNSIYFIENEEIAQVEGYTLEVTPDNIFIRAATAAGAFYAVQTLRQIFPPEFSSGGTGSTNQSLRKASCCLVEDAPRFQYRGLHLDVGRHFFDLDAVKKYIDLLAAHKLNVFHWHLTDDQGWRIEIKKYPRLQTVGACRNETLVGHYADQPHKFDGKKYCGYYTQEEVKEVVEYARQRFVAVVPEIEMPGHALAALAAYPELGCTGGPYETAKIWGVHEEVFCAGNDRVFQFLSDVLDEVCPLFPGTYFHVGGDECPKTRWKACPKCQKRIRENGLKDEHELQSYVIRRAEEMLAKHGKKLIGWDEILEGGLAPTATVMSWRGIEGGVAAAKAGHDVIMTPTSHCYFDYYQSDPDTEPTAIGGFLPIEKVYEYEPVPSELAPEQAKYVLGVQGNVWTEYIQTPDYLEYMTWPRAVALAEIAWTSRDLKNWKDFARRMHRHFARLEAMQVPCAKSFYDVQSTFENGKVALQCAGTPSVAVQYTTDGKEPDSHSSVIYSQPFALRESATVKARAFVNHQAVGKTMTVKYLAHKASGKPYTLSQQPNKYTGGETYGLTNGVVGVLKKWNAWVGLDGHDLDPLIDLGATTTVRKMSTHFFNGKDFWIYPPRSIEVLVSEDGKTFVSAGKTDIEAEKMTGASVENVEIDLGNRPARFVKVLARHFGKIPSGAPGEGNGAWIFLDEIIIE